MNPADIVVLLFVTAAVIAAVALALRSRRKRGGGCGCGCGCGGCKGCPSDKSGGKGATPRPRTDGASAPAKEKRTSPDTVAENPPETPVSGNEPTEPPAPDEDHTEGSAPGKEAAQTADRDDPA